MLLAFALSYLAMAALGLAMNRQHKLLFRGALSPARQRLLRCLALPALAAGLALCWIVAGGEIGAVFWLCQLMLAGLLLVALLAWRARWVLPLAALLPAVGGLALLV
jgi:hypothetical protein